MGFADLLAHFGGVVGVGIGDAQGAQDWLSDDAAARVPGIGFAHMAAQGDQHAEGNAIQLGQGDDAVDGGEEAVILHQQEVGFAGKIGAGGDANRLLFLGDFDKAERLYGEALSILRRSHGNEHPDTAKIILNLGAVLKSSGRPTSAKVYYEQALAILENKHGQSHAATADCLNNLGELARTCGDYDAAIRYGTRALTIRRETLGDLHADTSTSLNNLGAIQHDLGEIAKAADLYRRAYEIRQTVLGDHMETAGSLINLVSTTA